MKIIIGIIIVIACTWISYNISTKYTYRKNFFASFYEFNQALISEVAYTKKTIIALLEERSEKECFCKIVKDYFFEKIIPQFDKKILNQDEYNFLLSYLEQIGNTDSATQLNFLKQADGQLNDKLAVVSNEEKKYKSLYVKLGFLLGLLIFIIII